jgi:hypothetical protein
MIVSYAIMRRHGACASGIRPHFAALRAAGVAIPRRYTTLEVPLLTVLDACGLNAALDAAYWMHLDAPILRLFAADCAERALLREQAAGREPDPRSWAAAAVARRYARGEATDEELDAAWDAAWAAERRWQAARLRLYLVGAEVPPVTLSEVPDAR